MAVNPAEGQQMGTGIDVAQALATATALGAIQATLATVQTASTETLALLRAQGQQITDLKSSEAKQDTRLDGHDREFGEIRESLNGISTKLDAKGLTWPKLLAGGAALAAILSVTIAAIVAISNGLSYLAQIVERVG